MKCILFSLLFIFYLTTYNCDKNDYYQLLGIPRDATVKEIRKAFKGLAVKLHPDKNKDDKDADAKFIRLTKAYDILKDPNTRKHYDLYGEEQFDNFKRKTYHSYTYYRDQFGIYDDDPLIVTLSRNDYELNILDKNQAWFVNFYSPMCHHCHELAPTWRKLAEEVEGVVRIAAVNCEDDYDLCHQLSIDSYPTLLFYEKDSHLYEGRNYRGSRTLESLKKFVLDNVHIEVKSVGESDWEHLKNEDWLLVLSEEDNNNGIKGETVKKLSASLEGLLSVGTVDTNLFNKICKTCESSSAVFWKSSTSTAHNIASLETKEIIDNVLSILPNPEMIDDKRFQEIRISLRENLDNPWLLCFFIGPETTLDIQLKRLPTVIPDVNIGLVHCGKSSALCSALHISRYPTWGVIKVGGAFELHNGRDVLHEVANFARDSVKSTNLHALSPADFQNLKSSGETWFVDWYAPWCPPCKRLTPELRKASQKFDSNVVQFGTIDCTLHRDLCTKEGITTYPSIILYNGTNTHRFQGTPNEAGMVEFIQDTLNPVVMTLDENNFIKLLRKPTDELWIVDFYAPWCGPCQKLAPEFRRLAKSVNMLEEVKVAHLDCVANSDICESQSIKSYPTIRLYPLGSKGQSTVAIYSGNRDAVSLKRWILSFLPSNVETLAVDDFRDRIVNDATPWLVDFYAPWCGACVHFEPEFRTIARNLSKTVKSGKIDCEANRIFCGQYHVTSYPTVRLYISSDEYFNIKSRNVDEVVKKVEELIKSAKHSHGHDEL